MQPFDGSLHVNPILIHALSIALPAAKLETDRESARLGGDCGPKYLWTQRHYHLRQELPGDSYPTLLVHRPTWDYLNVFDREAGTLYLLMSDNRYWELQRNGEESPTHFSKTLALCNSDLDKLELPGTQFSLFEGTASPVIHTVEQKTELEFVIDRLGARPALYVILTIRSSGDDFSLSAAVVDSNFRQITLQPLLMLRQRLEPTQPIDPAPLLAGVRLLARHPGPLPVAPDGRIDATPSVGLRSLSRTDNQSTDRRIDPWQNPE